MNFTKKFSTVGKFDMSLIRSENLKSIGRAQLKLCSKEAAWCAKSYLTAHLGLNSIYSHNLMLLLLYGMLAKKLGMK